MLSVLASNCFGLLDGSYLSLYKRKLKQRVNKNIRNKSQEQKRIKETKESSSIENRGNSLYEEQQLPLRTTKVKKKTPKI